MFNVGPLEVLVLAVVGLIVLGPDRLPGLARDAARMLRTLRDMATGARTQLRDELGPEFADVDLRNLNPRTAISRMVLGDDADSLRQFNPRASMQDMLFGDESEVGDAGAHGVSMNKADHPMAPKPTAPQTKPLARGESAPFDADAT